jgi:hypothetical protein
MKIAYCSSYWCTNIGNGIFSLGVQYVLKQVFGDENVSMVYDLQTYASQFGGRKGISPKSVDYISNLDVDYVVIAGPAISKYFLQLWKDTIIKLHDRGIGYMLLSAGMMKCNDDTVKECREFFRQYPPYVLSTREKEAFDLFGDCAVHAYNGICCSFFVPEVYKPIGTSGLSPYIAVNFDKMSEPMIYVNEDKKFDVCFDFKGDRIGLKYTGLVSKIARKTDRFTDALVYAASILPSKNRSAQAGKYTLIRTDHRFFPNYRTKIYKYDNSFCADLPHTYINIYANTELTLSDRVHACATTLAYGNYAMCVAQTNRSALLERIGAADICNRPVKIDLDYLQQEKDSMLEWLKNIEY